ncbi:cell division cycle 20.2, cofactor of APC complex-like protein [Carex littledalei]|uniref:Cell division cycle 20.2, cofactor of APC complex-like protein n=1 Tax=Carex littledalei TaxID=544730 RepID=A0A833V563_9POAL|nr:cell division cycle 20.2, cofactor of APC complex-like protein [Carex littledalei]
MDLGLSGSSNSSERSTRVPDATNRVHPYRHPPLASSRPSSRSYGDRFIPNRSAMNMTLAQGLLTIPRKDERKSEIVSPSKEAYRKLLADTMLQGRSRILSFSNQSPAPIQSFPNDPCSTQVQPIRKLRRIPQKPENTFALPYMIGDNRLNLLDWGSNNVLAVAHGNTVYLRNATNGSVSELVTVPETSGPVTSVSWDPDCRRIAIGLNNSHILLYDPTTNNKISCFHGIHDGFVGSLAWNNYILTSGDGDGTVINNDVRIRSHVVSTYYDHLDAVCGLKWSPSGNYLASGGNDNFIYIYDASRSTPLHRFNNHTDTVRALGWCPFQNDLLASGGGETDHCIKFWDVNSGTCLNSVNTGSEVCSLLWNNNGKELLTSHGFPKNQLALWKYPSMVQMAEITDHKAPVLHMTQSPDGCTVASASEDETLSLWHIFEKSTKRCTSRTSHAVGPCNMYSHIR